ncbi:MAG: protein kinase [Deltaproteobacteria bacterium]|nr:protein kinase [Deltaproteobacteria bacterium]
MIGRGGMAAVYRCRDERGEHVAVKWLHRPNPAIERRFSREIRALSRLDHRGVVRILGHGVAEGRAFLVMEYLEGEDLRLWSHRLRRLPALERHRRIRRLAEALSRALACVHEHGLVHRDVKPSNVRVLESDVPVLTDFGVARDLAEDGETASGVVVGTLHYASPEQIRGEPVDPRTDLYGLGCTLYTVLTERRPFEVEDQAELLIAHLERAPIPPSTFDPTLPRDLEEAVLRLMAKRPEDRFPSARDAASAFSLAPVPAGVPLAGRRDALDRVAQALDRTAAGAGCLLRIEGTPGTGKRWLLHTIEDNARRRGLPFAAPRDRPALTTALSRLHAGEALLVATLEDVPDPDIAVCLHPLGRADVRRSVVAASRAVPDPACLAERLFQATGGIPALLVPLLEALHEDPAALDGDLPAPDLERWLSDLDLDALEVLQAIAVLGEPASAAVVEEVTQVPPEEVLAELVRRGLVRSVGGEEEPQEGVPLAPGTGRYVVSAGFFASAALERAPDPDALARRTRAALARRGRGSAVSRPWMAWEEALASATLRRAQNDLRGAEAILDALLAEAIGRRDAARIARARVERAWGAWSRGEVHEAAQAFAAALGEDDPMARGRAALGLGRCALLEGQAPRALARMEEAADVLQGTGDLAEGAVARAHLASVLALVGRPAEALALAAELGLLSHGLGDPLAECTILRLNGGVYLEVGLLDEAGHVLADASALSHATRLAWDRWVVHLLRARATLDARPDARTAAAAALDRLFRVLGDPPLPDPEGHGPLCQAILARAAAGLGDGRMFQRAQKAVVWRGTGSPEAIRTRIQAARAWARAGQPEEAARGFDTAQAEARAAGLELLAWQAARLLARLEGGDLLPPPGFLVGLDAGARQGMERPPVLA